MNKEKKFITYSGKKYRGSSHLHKGRWYSGVKHSASSKPLFSRISYSDFPRVEL